MPAANLIALGAGCVLCWTSPSLSKFSGDNATFELSASEAAWVGSLTPLGAAVGPIPAGILADKLGRKPTMLGDSVLLFLSWALIAFASSPAMLFAARFIAGLATGCIFTVLPMYIGEIAVVSAPKRRRRDGCQSKQTRREPNKVTILDVTLLLLLRRTACAPRWAP